MIAELAPRIALKIVPRRSHCSARVAVRPYGQCVNALRFDADRQGVAADRMGLDTSLRPGTTSPHGDGLAGDTRASEFDVRDIVAMVWRSKWLVLLFALIGFGAAYAHLLRITPLYTAETRVLWEIDQSNVVDLDPVARGLGSDFFALASQIEVLQSGRLLERVVDDLDLVSDPVFNASLRPPEGWTKWLSLGYIISQAKRQLNIDGPSIAISDDPDSYRRAAVGALGGAISAEWLDGTYVLIIKLTTPDPDRSAELANEMANFYILDQLETKFEATRQATDWLTDRVADLRIALETAEQAVETFSSNSTLV
ncbi:MAG TPA: Wzz/FepE/Etk N-terminal domain-containing protein, partial [Thermohalobaculum sp.]|nr:Wzz/FepE/Etk N-terminal domain-containing protein [Thermohalobaculum sp.]